MTDPTDRDPTTDIDPELNARLDDDATVTGEDLDRDSRELSDAELHPVGGASVTGAETMDFSLPEDDDPANQDTQSNADLIRDVAETEDDFPRSGDVTGGERGTTGSDALAGAGVAYDDGIDPSIRTEMLDNAMAYGDDFTPNNVNDEPSFDDGTPGSFSDFSVITPDTPGGTTRLADPNQDAGGEVRGPRVGGSGGIDGGPARTRPLPGTTEDE
ncbi:hypothetical protein DAETH_10820 [Deinococcus aetherius]|uniref:Phosphotransferase system, HPr-related protein n=1 Tax=Deinococcus aetherius TaxID=200252 RepID=A0ABN6RCM4_9DEIO|nr:hypothetical protein [Deinococcus aetherius]BDP41113.1 hypothetical protein DAETH_10820 [Deinococcus aetherius]